jgi:mannose-6-phosphate isomerase-like protein (cupin superfamily)
MTFMRPDFNPIQALPGPAEAERPSMSQKQPISINNLVAEMTQPWKPMDLVRVNSSIVRLVRLDGRFNWHQHHEDELFVGCGGNFTLEIEGGDEVPIAPGECYLIPAGVRHRPVALAPAFALLIVEAQTRHDFGVAPSS